jgi:Sulfotransferase family
MLNSHPELAMPRETRFVIEAWLRRKSFGDLALVANRERLARWIFEREKSHRKKLGLDTETAIERLKAAPPTLGSLLGTCFVMYAEEHGKPRWGDKRPMYAVQMRVVWDLFPRAQFVNVIRDPRACAASMRRLGWYDGKIAPAAELWVRSITAVDGWRRRLGGDQLMDVRYEDLVAEPERTAARVADFLGLASHEAAIDQMLSYHGRAERRSQRYHANLSRPPDPARVSAWTEALETREIALIEKASGSHMPRYGYDPAASGVSPSAELLGELRRRRRRQAAAQRKLAVRDQIMKLVTHRQPLAVDPSVTASAPVEIDQVRSAGRSH